MPLYEYECAKDGRFELIRLFSDPPLRKCPTCGRPVEKLVSASAFQFKGTGWYVTDYARKSEAKGNGTDAGGTAGGTDAGGTAGGKDAGGKKSDEAKPPDSSASKDTSKDAKTSTPSTSTSKESSAPKGSSPT